MVSQTDKKYARTAKPRGKSGSIQWMGVGEPDDMADASIVDVLCREARKKENRFYSDNGIQEFKDAASEYMKIGLE